MHTCKYPVRVVEKLFNKFWMHVPLSRHFAGVFLAINERVTISGIVNSSISFNSKMEIGQMNLQQKNCWTVCCDVTYCLLSHIFYILISISFCVFFRVCLRIRRSVSPRKMGSGCLWSGSIRRRPSWSISCFGRTPTLALWSRSLR